ncbi:unnamed protein product [Prorocentrum cordatum]|uniref:5'-nucleotidase n=1 Tax=Prorocentrum cordatum TaxID=2364126 RepID=A0ABN9U3R8_9DINO|nr:unnamed protein product [Polarella glacialis]
MSEATGRALSMGLLFWRGPLVAADPNMTCAVSWGRRTLARSRPPLSRLAALATAGATISLGLPRIAIMVAVSRARAAARGPGALFSADLARPRTGSGSAACRAHGDDADIARGGPDATEDGGCVIVCRGWGADGPGIAQAFTHVTTRHECRILDIAQFLLEGSLMFTFVLSVRGSAKLMQELAECAKERGFQLDFHFPTSASLDSPASRGDNQVVISVVSTETITPALLYDLDGVLCDHGCVVHEIEHRSDNKRENNGEYNKVSMRVGCPTGLKPATVMMDSPDPAGALKPGLQRVAWGHRAEVTIRWWDAMNRPTGKSLVVFGLSHVLCPYDVLDELLRAAGIDVEKASSITSRMPVESANQKKVSMLKGKPVEVLEAVGKKLKFTPGTKLVCAALKRMGFTLAILTNTGCREVADAVRMHLDIDYVICRDLEEVDGVLTGSYSGELTDISFRKSDLLKLMAEREQIEFRNVIAVGEPLKGLKRAEARVMMETFGPMVYFSTHKLKDLTIVLYLLGFHGTDVRALRKRRWEEGPGESAPLPPATKRFLVMVTARSREPGQVRKILAPLRPAGARVEVQTVKHCSLQDGGMCVGLQLQVQREEPDQVMKDLVFACHRAGFKIEEVDAQARLAAASHRPWQQRTQEACWQHYPGLPEQVRGHAGAEA